MLRLDRNIPFVNQIFALMRGDTTAEECIETLRSYEKKWDLQHVSPGLEIYPGSPVTAETYTFVHRYPERFGYVENLPEDEAHEREYLDGRYYGFLSETHLMLDTMAYSNNYDIVFSDKYYYGATQRAWAARYAKWANRTRWLGRENWEYIDFYLNLIYLVEG